MIRNWLRLICIWTKRHQYGRAKYGMKKCQRCGISVPVKTRRKKA